MDENFIVLFIVLIFHRQLASPVFFRLRHSLNLAETFEGLSNGSRLAPLKVDKKYSWVPAFRYGLTTPIGIAAGLGVRSTYNPGTPTASIVSGTTDSISLGTRQRRSSIIDRICRRHLDEENWGLGRTYGLHQCRHFDLYQSH